MYIDNIIIISNKIILIVVDILHYLKVTFDAKYKQN